MKPMNKNKSGQLVTTALLIGLVVLTIGLGVASRAITEVKLSRQEEESARAFNIAEAGIEELLKKTTLLPGVDDSEVPIEVGGVTLRRKVTVEDISAGLSLEKNQVVEIDTGTSSFTGDISISSDPSVSLAVMIYQEESGNYAVRRERHDGSATITVGSKDKLVRIKVYGKTKITVTGDNLPPLAVKITSRAHSEAVGETRQVEAERTAPGLPSIFDYVLFSGDGLL